MEKNYIKVIDNFLKPTYYNEIKRILEGDMFPWFYKSNISLPSEMIKTDELTSYGFFHMLDNNSPYGKFFTPFFYDCIDTIGAKEVIRARADMTMYSHKEKTHEPHVDMPNKNHWSAIYYVNDSDGDTIVYDELYDKKYEEDPMYTYKPEDFTEIKRVSPKANRLFIFNGLNMHTGQSPTKHKNRIIINCNFV